MKNIFKNILVILVFIILESTALFLYFSKDKVTWVKNINTISYFHNFTSEISRYFSLESQNKILNEDIAKLRIEIQQQRDLINNIGAQNNIDTTVGSYQSIGAMVINQTILKKNNVITINKGSIDGVKNNMSIISNGNIVGYITDAQDKISYARSILSSNINSSGALKKNNSLCSINWTGESPYELQFSEMTKYSGATVGDTVITTSFSDIYIPNINIGTISEIELMQDM